MTNIRWSRSRAVWLLASGTLAAAACTAPGGPDVVSHGFARPDAGVDTVVTVRKPELTCDPSKSSERLPARSTVVSQMAAGTQSNIFSTTELFDRFRTQCGGCHVDSAVKGYRVSLSTFAQKVTQQVIDEHIATDDKKLFMPPFGSGGVPYSQRSPNDPLVQMVALLEAWIGQGSPPSTFVLPETGDGHGSGNGGEASGYLVSPAMSADLTNIGNCVPGRDLIAKNGDTMADLDGKFAQATVLPDTLAETDLTTLDSLALANDGVVSFAPAYPLWADDAHKMRHVRVPLGETIAFDKATQQFQIPPNTRFYKTFLKRVIDGDGNESYRKIETRLIVARPDKTLPDGSVESTALYGTYVWNREETEAVLLTDPQRNLQPFKDRLTSYITDEPRAQAVIDGLAPGDDIQYALEHDVPGLVRHYAIPGGERCVQCHMGSPSGAFILGFTPLQIARHEQGESGVIEPAMGDELTQLQRLIDYGVISGMTSADDVVPLEKSQEPRQPRNQQELTAQAYMLGNCAHCHNPRGFPTVKSPSLKPLLDFLPSATGGVFQFPLERSSPLRLRGESQDIPMPYITPSLRDYPTPISSDHRSKLYCPDETRNCDDPVDVTAPHRRWVDAPWRSLLYRNVDAPWDYSEDSVIFPHMPRHTPGYDCRAPSIMGDWMVSIPAVLVHPGLDEDARPYEAGSCASGCPVDQYPPDANRDPQPYREVKPGDAGYADAVAAAQQRLAQYHQGHRYDFCPDTSDILDPKIVDEVRNGQPIAPTTGTVYQAGSSTLVQLPDLNIPLRPHWVVSDNTDPPGDWYPRRLDWEPALIEKKVVGGSLRADDLLDLVNVVNALDQARLEPVREELLREVPFGLWEQKAGCDFSSVKKVGDFDRTTRPLWMDATRAPDAAPVYSQSAGAALFTSICFNCHGIQADSKGLLADAIQLMTGGDARVANLRDGLFGPVASPGGNIARVFGPQAAAAGVQPGDMAARYLAWMALGGTEKRLPTTVLAQVGKALVLGAHRGAKLSVVGTPSMLRLGLKACLEVLPADTPNVVQLSLQKFYTELPRPRIDWATQTGLIDVNGDAEMWLRLCSLNNRPVVRVLNAGGNVDAVTSLYWGDAYPATAPVMDQHGNIAQGLHADNLFPLCTKSGDRAVGATGNAVPVCPTELFARDAGASRDRHQLAIAQNSDNTFVYTDARKWAARGAINAAMAVFLYLEAIESGRVKPQPLFNQCDKLAAAGR